MWLLISLQRYIYKVNVWQAMRVLFICGMFFCFQVGQREHLLYCRCKIVDGNAKDMCIFGRKFFEALYEAQADLFTMVAQDGLALCSQF